MDMGVKPELLTPSVQHSEKADFRAKVSGIAGDFEKSFRTGVEQQIVDDSLVLQGQRRQPLGECEDHMDVARREKFLATRLGPTVAGSCLTLRAVAVAAAVI